MFFYSTRRAGAAQKPVFRDPESCINVVPLFIVRGLISCCFRPVHYYSVIFAVVACKSVSASSVRTWVLTDERIFCSKVTIILFQWYRRGALKMTDVK